MRRGKPMLRAKSSSVWSGCWSSVTAAKAAMPSSVTVCDGVVIVRPTTTSSQERSSRGSVGLVGSTEGTPSLAFTLVNRRAPGALPRADPPPRGAGDMKEELLGLQLRGLVVATVLPFETDGAIDWAGYRRLLDHCAVPDDVDSVFVNGHAGEGGALDDIERV